LVLKDTKYNAISSKKTKRLQLGCWSFGPDLCDDNVEQEAIPFLQVRVAG